MSCGGGVFFWEIYEHLIASGVGRNSYQIYQTFTNAYSKKKNKLRRGNKSPIAVYMTQMFVFELFPVLIQIIGQFDGSRHDGCLENRENGGILGMVP